MFGLRPYFELIRSHPYLPAFGFATAFGSSFGQTFFIGVFSPTIQTEFGLSHAGWSSIYLAGTLASAAVLPWTGKQIDRMPLLAYATCAWVALGLACLIFSFATTPIWLAFGIFALRQSGQGLMSHVALTTMARYFDHARGRAIATATLGFATGQACLPFLAVVMLTWVGWRWSYRGGALLLFLAMAPALFLLARGHRRPAVEPKSAPSARDLIQAEAPTKRPTLEGPASPAPAAALESGTVASGWTRRQVLHDRRFYLLLPGLLCPSIVNTAMFFHHLNLADHKGWSHEWMTGSYIVFAVSTILTSLVAGYLIDRYSAARVFPMMLIPQAAGLLFIAGFDSPLSVLPYLALIAVTTGIVHTAVAALWAELYGIAHIGSIRSMAASVSVFGSALGPVTMGTLMDFGQSAERVCLLFAGYSVVGTILIHLALSSTKVSRSSI